jgi:type IV pilus assembly protein PilO
MALPPLDPDLRKKLLLGGALFLALCYVFVDQLYLPMRTENNELEARLANIRLQNTTARSLTQGANSSEDVEKRLALYRDQLQAVEALIPSSEELPDLLDAISAEAQRSRVELSLIQPVGATEEAYYTRRTYDMAVLGSYHDIGEFLTRVASLSRIVTPLNLALTPKTDDTREPGDTQRLEARFSIETYVIPSGQPTDAASAD